MDDPRDAKTEKALRRGWTTGACATAAAKAATGALFTSRFPDPVTIRLPGGQTPAFVLARTSEGVGWARASVIKDAGDDPDVTHGAEIVATVRPNGAGAGIAFHAGEGVGTVTRPGLPVEPGEPAINPVPRQMIADAISEVAREAGKPADLSVEVSVPGGAELSKKTWNPRLGIVGGISILGTTGIVVPYSCAAWIHAIHRGIDVARACGLNHVAGATGNRSEAAAQQYYRLPSLALIDMGDFAGGMLKYLRRHPVDRVTIAGGFAKLSKLADGALDLHSARSGIDLDRLAARALALGSDPVTAAAIASANTAREALSIAVGAGLPLADAVAQAAAETARATVAGAPVFINVLLVDGEGTVLVETGFA